jgi:beta-galactosidase
VEVRGADVLATFADGLPALTASGLHHYLACWPDPQLLAAVLKHLCSRAGLATIDLPAHIRLRRRGELLFVFNYGEESWTSPDAACPLLGGAVVPPQDLSVFKTT